MFDPPAEFAFDNRWDDLVETADLIGWDPDGVWCALFSIAPSGVATRLMERDHGVVERLRALPLRSVVAWHGCSYLWSIGDQSCTVWQLNMPPALQTDGDVVKAQFTQHARADLVEVCSFHDDEKRDAHGVEVALRDGRFHIIAQQFSEHSAWSVDLARTLAAHLGLPYRHLTPAGSKPEVEARKRAAEEQTARFIDGLVEAHHHWDDPDRVAAREAREAEKEPRATTIATRAHLQQVKGDVIARSPPLDPARRVGAVCGKPVFASTLTPAERARAVPEGRVVHVFETRLSSMGDTETHGYFGRRSDAPEDRDLVFAQPVPEEHVNCYWPDWETEDAVYDAFGVIPPAWPRVASLLPPIAEE